MTYEIGSAQDVVDYLTTQHDLIKAMFDEVLPATGEEREKAFHALRRMLAVHETAEEEIVHPRARHALDGGENVVKARLNEEHAAKQDLTELEKLDVDSPLFATKFTQLREDVLAHAEHEEKEEFGRLRLELDAAELRRMANVVELAELLAPTRPHPGVESAKANLIVGPFAAMLDRARDAINRP
jgi:hemerythrin superfamily protein